jgi:glycosyltransferase involved in cell wall biosynthesis
MERLARYEDIEHILYIETFLPITSLVKYLLHTADAEATRSWQRILSKGVVYSKGNIHVSSPLCPLPLYSWGWIQKANISVLNLFQRRAIRHFLRKLKMQQPILWMGHPYLVKDFIAQIPHRLVCYDLFEDYAEKLSRSSQIGRMIIENEEYLTSKADLIFAASEGLYLQKKRVNENTYHIPNAVDCALFEQDLSKSIPRDIVGIKHPIIGFVGFICNRLDFDLLEYLASSRPEWSLVLIGPADKGLSDVERLRKIRNIHFLGDKPFVSIPSYLKQVDVCIMCDQSNYQNRIANSLKLFAYLASGKPIVSYESGGAEKFSPLVRIAQDKKEFAAHVEDALQNDREELVKQRLLLAKQNSWDVRVEQIHRLIMERLEES